MKKSVAGIGLVVIALVVFLAVFSFLRENWAADQSPGSLERFIAGWLLSGSRRAVNDTPNPLPATESNLTEGQTLYQKHCAFCHGEDGRGSSGSGPQFYPPVPSLVDPNQTLSDAGMQAVITQGVRYTGMPSFAKALAEEQRWKIVLWLQHLRTQAAKPHTP